MEHNNWMFGRFSFSFRGDGFRFQYLVFWGETSGWKTSLNPGRLKKCLEKTTILNIFVQTHLSKST